MIRRAVLRAVLFALIALDVAHAQPIDPYAPAAPTPAAKPAPAAKKKPPAAPPVVEAPIDPYAAPTPTAPTPTAPTPVAGPIDPYAAPVATKPGKKPKPAKKPKPGAKPAPPPAVAGPIDPYGAPAPAPYDPILDDPSPTPIVVDPSIVDAHPPAIAVVVVPPVVVAAGRINIAAVQGLLGVQNLDGWLMVDHGGDNPVARSLVEVHGAPSRRWFYLVPRTGDPTLLVHASEVASFEAVPGRRVTYAGYRDLDTHLRALLKGKKTLAMEYSPKGALPSLSRVDAGTIELVRAAGVTVKSSEALLQFAKASWGAEGRKKHYLASHHLTELRKDALAYITAQLRAGAAVTERDVQARIEKGMATRGLVGPAPMVAFGAHTADPTYVPPIEGSGVLLRGDLIVLGLAGKVPSGVFAALSWVAVADVVVPANAAKAFEATSLARDEALALVSDRVKRRRAVKGWEVDKAARDFLGKVGYGERVLHRTGHSLDVDLFGSGTDLDDLEVKDPRNLVVGTGFTVGPGVYLPGELGLRTEVSAYLGRDGLEITTAVQEAIDRLLLP